MASSSPPGYWQEYLDSFRDPQIETVIARTHAEIDAVAEFAGIDASYLSVQVRLLLPFYAHAAIATRDPHALVRHILKTLRPHLVGYEKVFLRHREANGIDTIPTACKLKGRAELRLVSDCVEVPVTVEHVSSLIGVEIQEQLHYIHRSRRDTILHMGLHLPRREYPLCYAAISACDRQYQMDALQSVIGPHSLSDVVVLTRAFGFQPLPKNALGKLFDRIGRWARDELSAKVMITALNPLLGFRGSIFLGSSFVPFATSPMKYLYNSNGLFATRRSTEGEGRPAAKRTPPIVWLARSLVNETREPIEHNTTIVHVSEDAYAAG